MKVSVIGSGSWGIALSRVLWSNGHEVKVWSALKEEIDMLTSHREHVKNLPGIKIDEAIMISGDLATTVEGADILVMAVPSRFVRSTSELLKAYVVPGQIIVNVGKGLEDGSLYTLEQVIEEVLTEQKIAVLSGPSHAEEVARGIPTSVVAASKDKKVVSTIQEAFMNQYFRVYGSDDVLGVEMGGALKNVIALAAGISDGLGYGDNTKAALMTRGMAEISRLGIAMGASIKTFNGLSGMGDLIVTCTSMHSRNRRAGILIGQGKSLHEAQEEVAMVVEGVYAATAALHLAQKFEVEMPIIEQVNQVLFEGKSPKEAVMDLMERDRKFE